MATGLPRWWPWEHRTCTLLLSRSFRIENWWTGTPQPRYAAPLPARCLSQARRHSKSFSACAEGAQLLCCRDICIAMPDRRIPD
jgi:hypothetical protein